MNQIDENYKNLYAAIYKQAVADDIREVRKKVKEALGRHDPGQVRRYLDEMEPEIRERVCDAVYREAQEFGNGAKTRRMRRESIREITERIAEEFHGR